MGLINPIIKHQKPEFIPVDQWVPQQEDLVFKHVRGAIIAPVSVFYGMQGGSEFDFFFVSPKRSYNSETKLNKKGEISPGFREHNTLYLNYFEKFYDQEKELLGIYSRIKYLIDCEPGYTLNALLKDIYKYILYPYGGIHYKVRRMNRANYNLILRYRNSTNPCLEYTEAHASVLMEMSLFMNIMIPLVTHFIYVKKSPIVKDVLLEAYDMIFTMYMPVVDMYEKLRETAITNIKKNSNHNKVLWEMQSIRGKNDTVHAEETVENIIIQIIPKYTYDRNIICFNYNSIQHDIKFKVTDISYEYSFISLSSSIRDEDNNSEFDKFESHLTKQDEALYIQNKVNCEQTMNKIERLFGPFDDEEINFYIRELTSDGKPVINEFQKNLIFYLFFKYFGDPMAIKAINKTDYIKLMIAAKRILTANGLVVLPYILSGKVNRLVTRKNINKKELQKLEASPYYPAIQAKYRNDKIEKTILSIIAQILSSEFQIIDYENKDINGVIIQNLPEYICEEVLMYVLLI